MRKPIKQQELMNFFQSLDLHVFVKKMELPTEKKQDWVYQKIEDDYELGDILKPGLAIHFELSDYNYHKADLWGVGISDGKNHYYLSPEFALSSINFQMYLTDPSIDKLTYDYKAAKVFLLWHGLDLVGVSYDLLLSAYLINSHLGKEEFKRIVSAFEYEDILYDDVVYGKGAKKALPEKDIYERHIASKAKAIIELKTFSTENTQRPRTISFA
jgi:DNA polymerase I